MRIRKSVTFINWLVGISLILFLILLPWKIMTWRYANQIFLPQSAPSRWLAIVFGAGLRRDGKPSSVLADRVIVAANLYHEGKISKILMSGSAQHPRYNEPLAMRELAIELGVDPEDILIDTEGSRTYETCRRAQKVYNVNSALLVSQRFHLPRALGICEALGMDAVGVSADLRSYGPLSIPFWQLREIPATLIALWDAYLAPDADNCYPNAHSYLSIKGNHYES